MSGSDFPEDLMKLLFGGASDEQKKQLPEGAILLGDGTVLIPLSTEHNKSRGIGARDILSMIAQDVRKKVLAKKGTEETPASEPRWTEPFATDDNGPALLHNGLRVVHFHGVDDPYNGMTVAFRNPKGYNGPRPSTIEISTAVCHPKDRFNKKEGTAQAIRNFLDGKTVIIPVLHGLDVAQSIKTYFDASISRRK